jgi:hypothetical protein
MKKKPKSLIKDKVIEGEDGLEIYKYIEIEQNQPNYNQSFTTTFGKLTIYFKKSWNLFSASSFREIPIKELYEADKDNILIKNTIYTYNEGFRLLKIDYLKPGFGYWIKCNEEGIIELKN